MTEVKAMTKFYDVTFQELSGRSVVKTEVASDREPFDVWQDACASYSETELNIQKIGRAHV